MLTKYHYTGILCKAFPTNAAANYNVKSHINLILLSLLFDGSLWKFSTNYTCNIWYDYFNKCLGNVIKSSL